MGKLKLFVWEDVFEDYTPGIAFAIAETEEEAIALVLKVHPYGSAHDLKIGRLHIHKLTEKVAYAINGGG